MPAETFTPPERRKNGKFKARVSAISRSALEVMALEGVTPDIAAQRVGMNVRSLKAALRKPHVKALFNQMVKDVRENAAQAAYLRINHMATVAESERLKFDASRWVAGVDGISPVTKSQGTMQHTHNFGGFTFDEGDTIDGEITDSQSVGDDD